MFLNSTIHHISHQGREAALVEKEAALDAKLRQLMDIQEQQQAQQQEIASNHAKMLTEQQQQVSARWAGIGALASTFRQTRV